ncbi:MAG: hypothetical protein SNJ54_10880 [Anaerolineae bacterium]
MQSIRLIALAAVLLMLVGCEGMFSLSEPCVFPQDDVAFYENWLEVKLPGSTSNFSVRCSRWMDHHQFWMQFDIAPEDLAALQAGIDAAMTWQENTPPTQEQARRLESMLSMRALDAMRSYLLGVNNFDSKIAVIDMSDPQAYRVFLYVFRSF